MDRVDLAARNAACVRLADIEFDGLNKLLEGRRLQNDIALFVGDQARSVEDDTVVSADQIDEYYRLFLQFGTMSDHIAAEFDLSVIVRRRVDRNDNVGAHPDHLVGRIAIVQTLFPKSLVVPKILANDDAEFDAVDVKDPAMV